VVDFDGQLKGRKLKNKRKKHIGQGIKEIHGIW
jgi:hypothetical protein